MNEIAYLVAEATNHVAETAPIIADATAHATNTAMVIAEGASHATEVSEDVGLLGTFGLDWKLFLAQLINFGIIVFVLTKFVFKPLIKTMDERKAKLEKGVKDADEAEKALTSAKDAEAQIVADARKHAKELVDEAKQQGESEKQKRVQKSSEIIATQLEESKKQAMRDAEQAMGGVRKDIGVLVAEATNRVTNGLLDEKKHRKLIDEAISELETHG